MRSIRVSVLCAAALAASVVSSIAADMPQKVAPNYAPPVVAPTFAGFYVGGHVGGGWNVFDANREFLDNVKPSGVVWGGHAGYNWQPGVFVVGLELAFTNYNTKKDTYLNVCDSEAKEACIPIADDVVKIRYVGDALAKVGGTLGPNVLVYGTAGVSWAAINFGETGLNAFGWAAGGGIDWVPFGKHIVLGARYLYRDLGKPTGVINDLTGHEATGRISYKF